MFSVLISGKLTKEPKPGTGMGGIAACGVGVESGLPVGGRWYTDRHLCDRYRANGEQS